MITDRVKKLLPKIAAYFVTQPVVRAWVFGSYARGEESETSDIDILVDYDKSNRLSLLLGIKVDLVENGRLKEFAVESVNHDKFLIYERANQGSF